MKTFNKSAIAIIAIFFAQIAIFAQGNGSIAGTVSDQTGAVVPGATIAVKGDAGQKYTVVASNSGTFNIPAVQNGLYAITVSAPNFKTSVVSNVKVDLGKPTAVDVALQAGRIEETVVITSGGEVLQTETATIASTITGRQIVETPITSRDALDLITQLPGTTTTGAPRTSTINGLPKGAIAITVDGVDVQDNYLRSSDGFFTYVRPRVDAIEEVTVSTSNPGAESSGDGAVQIQFATRRGTNNYNGGLFWQHRNTALNANYWYNNRDKPTGLDENNKAKRSRNLLNQYGVHWGGPLPFLGFGEGTPAYDSGRDKRFFFVNYEEFRLPESSPIKTRAILKDAARAGNFTYDATLPSNGIAPAGCTTSTAGQMRCTRNVFTAAAAAGLPSTGDLTVTGVLNGINSGRGAGSIIPITNDLNRENLAFVNTGLQIRKFLAARFDVNVTKRHTVTDVLNLQKFQSSPYDILNGSDPTFPGAPTFGSQNSQRNSNSLALRSSLRDNLINEFRWAKMWGATDFSTEVDPSQFADQGGYNLVLGFGLASWTTRNSWQRRGSPTNDISDNLSWVHGTHTTTFGGQWKRVVINDTSMNLAVPQINFGLSPTLDTAAFNALTSTANFPGINGTDPANVAALYALLTGRVSQYGNNAYLVGDNTYQINQEQTRSAAQRTFGIYAQDSWKLRPNLTFTFGLRWQPQEGFELLTANYSKAADFNDVYGLSGAGNIYKPGTLTGRVPQTVGTVVGERATPTDWNNLAPSIGIVWSPAGDNGLSRRLFGGAGKSVLRGGWSRAFIREGTLLAGNILGSNPGGLLGVTRSTAAGTLPTGILLRNGSNSCVLGTTTLTSCLSPLAYPASPAYPYTLSTPAGDAINAFDANLKTGYVDSWSVGYQREINKNTVVELRYVGNRGKNMWRQYNLNELNVIENGFAAEFLLAQQNLYANRAANRGNTFAYFGAGTGTSPLPIIMSYANTSANYDPNNPVRYAAGTFGLAANIAFLNNLNSNVQGLANALESVATNRTNAINNGRASNFFYVNPTTRTAGAFIVDNGEKSWYDAATVEVRRRLSAGVRLNASYSYAKAFTNSYSTSAGNDQVNFNSNFSNRDPDLQKTISQQDVRHSFKFEGTLDLPFGRGRQFASGANGFLESIIGGWSISPVVRWQSGAPIVLTGVQLVGMTAKDLEKAVGVYKGGNVVTWLPDDIILNTQRAFDLSSTSATGYGTTFGGVAPTGRFIAPSGYGGCVGRYFGECGSAYLALHGPSFFKVDTSVIKRFKIGERRDVQFRVSAYDLLNHPNFRVGGFGANTVVAAAGGLTFGQLATGSAYQDANTTNDPGGRIVEFMLRVNW